MICRRVRRHNALLDFKKSKKIDVLFCSSYRSEHITAHAMGGPRATVLQQYVLVMMWLWWTSVALNEERPHLLKFSSSSKGNWNLAHRLYSTMVARSMRYCLCLGVIDFWS